MNQRLMHAIEYAVQKHVLENQQMYGLLPFSHHLEHVYKNVQKYSKHLSDAGVSLEDVQALECAAWLHDVLEDCKGVKRMDLRERFGTQVETLVYLVTDEPFPMTHPKPNRQVRHAMTYEKVRSHPLGVYLKLCDRIANVQYGGEAMKMYRTEYDGFKRAVYTPGQWEDLWAILETELLIGDREGVLFKQPAVVHVRRTDTTEGN